MARADRLSSVRVSGDHDLLHLTHRRHPRAFLPEFACDGDANRALVREQLK